MTIQEIDGLIEEGISLKQIAQAYSDIANLKVRGIREAVLRNRSFFDEISKVYGIVRAFAIKKGIYLQKPKKRLDILLTSNYRFYGNINSALINYFIGSTRELTDVDRIIIGKGGIDFFRATKLLKNYSELQLLHDMPVASELASLSRIISQYSRVLVFHSKLKSLLNQRITFTDLTATSFYLTEFQVKRINIHFIFEPEVAKILSFFDSQILTLLLEQTFLESELSRNASRFVSMDQAQIEADKFVREYQRLKTSKKLILGNLKILENFATLMAVKKEQNVQ
ncbi:MAG: F0F1 ATP synthase subunit gamma [Patescibacteria group bacterium]